MTKKKKEAVEERGGEGRRGDWHLLLPLPPFSFLDQHPRPAVHRCLGLRGLLRLVLVGGRRQRLVERLRREVVRLAELQPLHRLGAGGGDRLHARRLRRRVRHPLLHRALVRGVVDEQHLLLVLVLVRVDHEPRLLAELLRNLLDRRRTRHLLLQREALVLVLQDDDGGVAGGERLDGGLRVILDGEGELGGGAHGGARLHDRHTVLQLLLLNLGDLGLRLLHVAHDVAVVDTPLLLVHGLLHGLPRDLVQVRYPNVTDAAVAETLLHGGKAAGVLHTSLNLGGVWDVGNNDPLAVVRRVHQAVEGLILLGGGEQALEVAGRLVGGLARASADKLLAVDLHLEPPALLVLLALSKVLLQDRVDRELHHHRHGCSWPLLFSFFLSFSSAQKKQRKQTARLNEVQIL
eukprot:Rhum_TRINITY_DN24915_c0_g1::Rhum_TRINITY_DN24915_c0_g1_i1::g.180542::m.180542